jgi:hypothetical protein
MQLLGSLTLALILTAAAVLSGCQTAPSGASTYDPLAHDKAMEVKGTALALMAVAGEPYAQHSADVEALNGEIQAAYEAAATGGRSEQITREWELIRDPAGDLFGGFVHQWQTAGTVSGDLRDQMIPKVSRSFDYILCLELAKKSGGICAAGEDASSDS